MRKGGFLDDRIWSLRSGYVLALDGGLWCMEWLGKGMVLGHKVNLLVGKTNNTIKVLKQIPSFLFIPPFSCVKSQLVHSSITEAVSIHLSWMLSMPWTFEVLGISK